jgi:hypothetical protein
MRTIATCLLLIYVSVSCRPVFPVLADGLAHLLWYEDHVATVHMHGGMAHVHAEIADAMADDTGEQGKAPVPAKSFKISDFLSAHMAVAEVRLDNIPCWNIFSAGVPDGSAVLVGLYSSEVPVPPPNHAHTTEITLYQPLCIRTCAASVPPRSRRVCTCLKYPKTRIPKTLVSGNEYRTPGEVLRPGRLHHTKNGHTSCQSFLFFTNLFTVTV